MPIYRSYPTAWGGRYCENDVDGCSELICFEGVQCYDVVAPGYGAICGPCPDGYQGDGEKCTGKYNVELLHLK